MMLMDDQYLLRSRAKPKSQSFTTPSLVRRMFSGLTSRWMQLWAWQYPTACNVCQMIRFVNTSGTLHRESRDRSFPVLKTLYLSPGHKHGHSPPAVDGHYIWTFWVADSPSQHLLRIQLETSSPLDLHPYEKSCIHRHWSIQADEWWISSTFLFRLYGTRGWERLMLRKTESWSQCIYISLNWLIG